MRVCHLITKQHKTPNRAIYMLRRLGVDLEDQTSEQDAEFIMEVCPPNVNRFRGGLVFKAHRRVCHPTLGLRVIKKKKVWTGRP